MRSHLRLWRPAVLCILVTALSHPALLIGAELSSATSPERPNQVSFELRARGNQLSLKAEQASVKAILDAIGRQMRIEMIVRLREDRPVTATFADLSLQEALKRLGLSTATVIEKDQQGAETVTKMVVLDKGAEQLSPTAPVHSLADSGQRRAQDNSQQVRAAMPLTLEIDPSQALRNP